MSGRHWQGRNISRRRFLGGTAAAGAGLALAAPAPRAGAHPVEGGVAANVIFMVADGMSAGTLALGDLLHREQFGERCSWARLMRHERTVRAMIDTRSANSMVTDSAASSSAWSIGALVNNDAVCVKPDGVEMSPLLLRARESGRATGLVTTTRVTHATPAGFAANSGSRGAEDAIAAQLIDRGYDLLMGGGARHFSREVLNGRPVVTTARQLRDVAPGGGAPFVGLFAESHMSFEIDRPDHEPSLEEMTRFAIAHLAARGSGFVLQIEGGRVDHAAHNNDAGALLREQVAFDRAVAVASEFALSRRDTLLVVTTDHGTANPALTDYADAGAAGLARARGITRSFEWIARQYADSDREARTIARLIEQATGIVVTPRERGLLEQWSRGEETDPFSLANRKYGPLGSILANHVAIAFLSPNHTSDFVEFTAVGPGTSRVRPFMAIHEVHEVLRGALDLPPARPM